jgi:hypothetical protein
MVIAAVCHPLATKPPNMVCRALGIEVKWLRIELAREVDDAGFSDFIRAQ